MAIASCLAGLKSSFNHNNKLDHLQISACPAQGESGAYPGNRIYPGWDASPAQGTRHTHILTQGQSILSKSIYRHVFGVWEVGGNPADMERACTETLQ